MNQAIKNLFKWDYHYERGFILGFVVMLAYYVITSASDATLLTVYQQGNIPYGVLWTWINPLYWIPAFYRVYIFAITLLGEYVQYRFFVKKGKMSRWLFYAGWLQSIMWIHFMKYQNVTVTLFAPLVSVYPYFVIPFMALQKLPLGWSWNLSDSHWACAFNQTTYSVACPTNWQKYQDLNGGWFGGYVLLALWVIIPLAIYARRRWKARKK